MEDAGARRSDVLRVTLAGVRDGGATGLAQFWFVWISLMMRLGFRARRSVNSGARLRGFRAGFGGWVLADVLVERNLIFWCRSLDEMRPWVCGWDFFS